VACRTLKRRCTYFRRVSKSHVRRSSGRST